jgi:hypothetical protein
VFGNIDDLHAELLLLRSEIDEIGRQVVAIVVRWKSLGLVIVVGPDLLSKFDQCEAKSSG